MATEMKRVTFAVPDDVMKRIDDYQHDHREYNRTQAIIKLLNAGLASLSRKPAEEIPRFTQDEIELIAEYRSAEPMAQNIARTTLLSYPAQKKEHRA